MGSDGGDDEKEKSLLARIVGVVRRKARTMGPAALLAYIMIDIAMYSFALVGARAAFLAATGREPWQDLTGFLLVLGGFWAGNNATKPARVAAAAALAPVVGRATAWVESVLPGAIHQAFLPGLQGVPLSTVASPLLLLAGWAAVWLPLAAVCAALS